MSMQEAESVTNLEMRSWSVLDRLLDGRGRKRQSEWSEAKEKK